MQGFRLGSIFGFEIRIDLSWFLIFFLILWSLSVGLFPENFPELSQVTYWIMGIVATLLFFVSLIAHELSHSLVARTKGIPVEGITLFIFGGISRTRMESESPGDEFQIAGVGPLVSVLLAVVFGLLWSLSQNFGWSTAVTGVLQYLASINLLLAIFNLLPGFPLDGGRLFRAIVWKVTGSLKRATRIASWGGRFLAYLIIALGIVQLFSGAALLSGVWLIFIGWFLHNAAELSYQEYLIRQEMEGVKAHQVMTPSPDTVPSDLTVQQLVDEYLMRRRYQAFPVIKNDHPLGIVTLNQVKQIPREQWKSYQVEDIMKPVQKDLSVHPDENMSNVLDKMQDTEMRRVLVTKNGDLQGIITASDVSRWLHRRQALGVGD